MTPVTAHARARMQQRGISAAQLDALLDFGRFAHAGGGRAIVFFRNRYAIVESDGTVITVGHRYRRIPRGR